jgi:hypothetical protein
MLDPTSCSDLINVTKQSAYVAKVIVETLLSVRPREASCSSRGIKFWGNASAFEEMPALLKPRPGPGRGARLSAYSSTMLAVLNLAAAINVVVLSVLVGSGCWVADGFLGCASSVHTP